MLSEPVVPTPPLPTGYPEREPDHPVRYVPFETLLKCGRAVKTRGKDLIYQYAGENPQKRFVTFGSRKIARLIAGDLLMDLRKALTDTAYNRVLDGFRGEIRASQEIERAESSGELVAVPCPECGTVLQLAPVFADKAQDFCPKCNAVEPEPELVIVHKGRSLGATDLLGGNMEKINAAYDAAVASGEPEPDLP